MEHLVDCYNSEGIVTLKQNEVKMVLKDVALISRSRSANPDFELNAIKEPTLKGLMFSR